MINYTFLHINIAGIPSLYGKYAVGRKMSVASPCSVILFNFRGSNSETLGNLVLLSGQQVDGVRALEDILKDAVTNHEQASLKIPRKAIIKMKSK